jgi:hypothetical protein
MNKNNSSNSNNSGKTNGRPGGYGSVNDGRHPQGNYEKRSVEPTTTSLSRPDVPPAKPKS